MIICIKTRKIIEQKPLTALDILNERFSDSPLMLKSLAAGQKQKLPYHGHCVHLPYKSRICMPIPNFNFKGLEILGDWIMNSSKPDPFMHMDVKYKITLNSLNKAKIIFTRSDLISHDSYIDRLSSGVEINLVFSELNNDEHRKAFPGCPSQLRLYRAYAKLKNLGFKVNCINTKNEKIKIIKTKNGIQSFLKAA